MAQSLKESQQISELEQAILKRAENMVAEQYAAARQNIERLKKSSQERLNLREQQELRHFKTEADYAYHRLVQAKELSLHAKLDELRWQLVQSVMEKLRERLKQLTVNETDYLPFFHRLLKQAVESIERDELTAEVNPRDYQHLQGRWQAIAQMVAPAKKIRLDGPETGVVAESMGGVRVCSQDQRICVDNTFEGLISRLETDLQRLILERLNL